MSDTVAPAPDANAIVTHEVEGRTLSGVGASAEGLAAVMEQRTPEAPEEAPAAAPASEPAPLKKGRQRFFELAQARKEAEAKAAALEKELTELKAQKAAPPAAPVPPVPSSPPAAQSSPSVPNGADSGRHSGRQQPSEDEIGTKYKNYAEFVVDSARWVAEQQQSDIDARIRQSIEADRASRDFLTHAESTWAKGRKVYADFDAMRTSGPGSQVPMDANKINAILFHPQSEHLQYAIVKDGTLAQRLAQASPIEFGLILSTLAPAATAGSLASTAPAGTVTPPAPVQPVGSGSPTSSTSLTDAAAQGMDAYRERRNAMRMRNRR